MSCCEQVPPYYSSNPPRLSTAQLAKFAQETLFYMFYAMPGDEAQVFAADELSQRGWWFHKEHKVSSSSGLSKSMTRPSENVQPDPALPGTSCRSLQQTSCRSAAGGSTRSTRSACKLLHAISRLNGRLSCSGNQCSSSVCGWRDVAARAGEHEVMYSLDTSKSTSLALPGNEAQVFAADGLSQCGW